MLRSISYCGLRMEYSLIKKDVKNINIRITEDGEITVSAPIRVAAKVIDEYVESKAEWIFRKMADVERRRECLPDDGFYEGKTLYYLGNEYVLRLEKGRKFEVEMTDDEIIVYSRDGDENLKPKYINWLMEKAQPVFEDSIERMMELVKEYNIEKPEFYIRNMKSRWGSCNNDKKRIGLNVQLMKADTECIDKVVLHELIHFICFDHSSNFYAIMDKSMPDWKERKIVLDQDVVHGL